MPRINRFAPAVLMLGPGALTVYLSFNAGGYFVGAPAAAAVAMALVLVLRVTTADAPFAGIGAPVAIALAALGLLSLWTLVSGFWSDAPARATLEFSRILLYTLTFLAFASYPCVGGRLSWMVRGLALGIAVVCLIALTTRLAPDVWPTSFNVQPQRLSYPVTYWNGLGLLASVGMILCFHLSSSLRQPVWARVVSAALVPPLAATLLLTLSRGAIAALVIGLLVYMVLGRPHGLLSAVLAVGPATAIAVVVAYRADRLTGPDPTGAEAVAQGHDVALAVGLCVVGAALIRVLLLGLDRRLGARRASPRLRRVGLAAAAATPVLIAAIGIFALDAPAYVERQYDRFVTGDPAERVGAPRGRLTDAGNSARIEQWNVGLESFHDEPLTGGGAGTYQLEWARARTLRYIVIEAHSLYVEVLGELGIVGLALVAVFILTILVGLARRVRGMDRSLHAAVLAVALAWALHAGIDWDWELPAVTLWFFALTGAGLAAAEGETTRLRASGRVRVLIALGLLILAITPARAGLSQHHLDEAVAALKDRDCPAAIASALSASSAMPVRPEPWEVLGYCDAGLGHGELSVRAFRNAISRDPANWELHYGLALARGSAGLDPRRAAGRARQLNPLSPVARDLAARFRTSSRSRWMREARASRILIP